MSSRRVLAVFGGALSGFSFGGGVELFFGSWLGPPMLLAGLGFGIGVGALVAATIRN